MRSVRVHGVPLNTWLGGAVRSRVSLACVQPLDAVAAVPADVRRVALTSAESDAARLVAMLGAAAATVGT